MSGFRPEYLVLHDYGGTPKGDAPFNPYHTLVAGGRKIYRDPANPYGAPAPHAYKFNPRSIGLSWGGAVGGTPDENDLKLLREEVENIRKQFPDIKILSHGEAYAQTKGTPQQASRDGRGLEEAAWRRFLDGSGPMPQVTQTASSEPLPVSQRGITAFAGMTPPAAEQPASAPLTGSQQGMGLLADTFDANESVSGGDVFKAVLGGLGGMGLDLSQVPQAKVNLQMVEAKAPQVDMSRLSQAVRRKKWGV
jgi:hypothetical protein